MPEPWAAEDRVSMSLREEGHSSLSPSLSRNGFICSSASMMVPAAILGNSKRENQKLPIRSIIAMTCGIGGYASCRTDCVNTEAELSCRLQILWSTIFSHGSPYLFSLGISTTQSSLVWATAPICGSIVQPIVGVISDQSRISWGRRRPFILGGVMATVFAAMMLAWAESISEALCTLFGISGTDAMRPTITRSVAILAVILLNISIQPLQLGLRSLSVDVCPQEQQSAASAWASRFAGVGNITGYMLGSLPLPWISSEREAIRFRYMVYCTVVALITTTFINCYYTEEEDPRMSAFEPGVERRTYRILRLIMGTFSETSQRVRRVFLVQFFSFLGWFGFLFYSTSFISQLYVDEQAKNNITTNASLRDHGMRIGAMANLLFAIVALATNILLPRLAHIATSMDSTTTSHEKKKYDPFSRLRIIWGFGQLVYVVSVFSTVLVSSSTTGAFIIAIAGFSWGITQWVPFAIIGQEAARFQSKDDSTTGEDDCIWSSVQGGRIIGMHNAAISVPQIIAALISSVIFWVTREVDRESATVWVIGWSGFPGAIAAWLAFVM